MFKHLDEALRKYREIFGDSFPTIPIMNGKDEKDVIEMIENCIKAKKDAYDNGYLILDGNTIY